MSFLANAILLGALAAVGALAFALHRRLQRLGDDLAEYRGAMEAIAGALAAGESAVRALSGEGREVAELLAARVAEARAVAAPPESDPVPVAVDEPRVRRAVGAADFRVLAGEAPVPA